MVLQQEIDVGDIPINELIRITQLLPRMANITMERTEVTELTDINTERTEMTELTDINMEQTEMTELTDINTKR